MRPENSDTEVQNYVFFPKGWSLNICLLWLKLRQINPPLGHTEADVYGYNSIYATNPNAIYGWWHGGDWGKLRYCFKRLLYPRECFNTPNPVIANEG